MQYEILSKGVTVPADLERAVGHKVRKVVARLKRYHPDAANLEVRMEQVERTKAFRCKLRLTAFKTILRAVKEEPELRVAVDKCFVALLREMDHHRDKINKSFKSSA